MAVYAKWKYPKVCRKVNLWDSAEKQKVKVEKFQESLEVRGNSFGIDPSTGHFYTSNDYYTTLDIEKDKSEQNVVLEYIPSGRTMYGIRKEVINKEVVFTHTLYEAYSRETEKCERIRTADFVGIVDDGNTYPENGKLGDYWYIRKNPEGEPSVISMNDGEMANVYYSEFTGTYVHDLVIYPGDPNKETRYFLEYTRDNDFSGGKWRDIKITSFNKNEDGTISITIPVPEEFYDGEPVYLKIAATGSDGYLSRGDVGKVMFEKVELPQRPSVVFPEYSAAIIQGRDVVFRWKTEKEEDNENNVKISKYKIEIDLANGKNFTLEGYGDNPYHRWRVPDLGTSISKPLNGTWKVSVFNQYNGESQASRSGSLSIVDVDPFEILNINFNNGKDVVKEGDEFLVYSSFDTSGIQLKYFIAPNDDTSNIIYKNSVNLSGYKTSVPILLDYDINEKSSEIIEGVEYALFIDEFNSKEGWRTFSGQKFPFTVKHKELPKPSLEIDHIPDGALLILVYEMAPTRFVEIQRRDVGSNVWRTIGKTQDQIFPDIYTHPRGSYYRIKLINRLNVESVSDEVYFEYRTPYPMLTNTVTGKTIRLWDIVKTSVKADPDKVYHKMAGRQKPVVEKSIHSSRTLNLEWEVRDLEIRDIYLDFINGYDVFLYRDAEGRHLFVTIDSYSEDENYNEMWWKISLKATEVTFFEGDSYVVRDEDISIEEYKGGNNRILI